MAQVNVKKKEDIKGGEVLETRELDPGKYSMANPQFRGKSKPESKQVRANIFTR